MINRFDFELNCSLQFPLMTRQTGAIITTTLTWLRTAPENVVARFYRTAIVGYVVALVVHFGYILLFGWLGIWPLAIFNILSVALWILAVFHLKKGRVLLSWMIGVAELTLHAILAVHFLGAQTGFQFFLFVLAVMSFILPVNRMQVIPITAVQTLIFILLIYYDQRHAPVYGLPTNLIRFFLVSNIVTTVVAISAPLFVFMDVLERTETALANAYAQSESLLRNILPAPIADRLKEHPGAIADSFPSASILFADIVEFSMLAERLPPQALVNMLNGLFEAFDELAEKHQVEKIKTVGDAYMVASGVPQPRPDHATAIALFALDARKAVTNYNAVHGTNLQLRIGIHTGPVTAGVIGKLRFLYDLWGDAVNTAARMESHGLPGAIQVSDTTYAELRDNFLFDDRGLIDVKGKGMMHTWWLTGVRTR